MMNRTGGMRHHRRRSDEVPQKMGIPEAAPATACVRMRHLRLHTDVLRPMTPNAQASRSWWARQDSNLQPDGYEPSALTIELRARMG